MITINNYTAHLVNGYVFLAMLYGTIDTLRDAEVGICILIYTVVKAMILDQTKLHFQISS